MRPPGTVGWNRYSTILADGEGLASCSSIATPPKTCSPGSPNSPGKTDPVLQQLDRLLEDDRLYAQVRADLGRRYPKTLSHGRHSTPAEAILRLLIVKHLYNWSYRETEQRVADSLVLRWFCRLYFQRVPDATTLLRWAHTIQPTTLHALNDRVVQLARQVRVNRGAEAAH
jgi:transposase, IS5 family